MWPHSILKETKDKTRIYVFVGEPKMLLRFMNQMKVEQLFADGEYMVVYLFPDTADYDDLGFFLWDLGKTIDIWQFQFNLLPVV